MQKIYGVIALLLCWSCNKVPDHSNKVYFTQATGSPLVPLTLDNSTGQVNLNVASSYVVTGDVTVGIATDTSYLSSYNQANQTAYEPVPASAVTLSAAAILIKNGSATGTDVISVQVHEWPGFNNSRQYVVPVRITGTSNGMNAIPGSNVALVRVVKVINGNAAQLNVFDNPYSDGSYSVVSTAPTTTFTPASQFTIEGRFKITGDTKNFTNWFGALFSGTGFFFVINQGTNNLRIHIGSLQFSVIGEAAPGVWHHFALVADRGNCTVYLDERVLLKTTISGNNSFGPGTGAIGSHAGAVNMAFSEYRVWKMARTSRQLASNVCAADPADPDLIAYWPLNQANTDQTANTHRSSDVTGHGYDLVLNPTAGRSTLTWITVKCPE